jgi:hypothetical protein
LLRAASREPERAEARLEKAARTLDSVALLTAGLVSPEMPFRRR